MAYVLAGGRGSRLMELTDKRAKPAVFFGGKTRIIDFALSNALNSGIRRIAVATQYKAHSLIRHLQRGWNFLRPERNESFDILPASQRISESQWYSGTADAVFQNIDIIESYKPTHVVILAGDHIYKMDYELMLQQHVDQRRRRHRRLPRSAAHGGDRLRRHACRRQGPHRRLRREAEGSAGHSRTSPTSRSPRWASTSSRPSFLFDQLRRDAADPGSSHDFGKDIIPYIVENGKAVAHRFAKSCVRSADESEAYWRDVGTVDAYWEANIDLTDIVPALDLYDHEWPIWTNAELTAPAKFVHDEDGRRGAAVSSLVSGGCIVSGASVRRTAPFHRRPRQFLCRARRGGGAPLCRDRARRAAHAVSSSTAASRSQKASSSARTPKLDATRFRRTDNGVCLITQLMINKLAAAKSK